MSGGPQLRMTARGAATLPRLLVAAAVLAVAALAGLWLAGVAAPGGAGGLAGPWNRLVVWIFEEQARFHRLLTGALGALRDREGGAALAASATLVGASFLYGVFHAAGPGHGKAVIGTYLLTQRRQLRRGIALAVASSFCQGLVALLLVYGLIGLAGWLPRDSGLAVSWSERLSFALVAGVGLLLALRALRALWRRGRASPAAEAAQEHRHAHHHGGAEGCPACAHGPSAAELARAGDWRSGLGIVLSVGLRPCSGALVVLVFARASGLDAAGIAAVAAVSAGTAITVSALAWLAVNARDLAGRVAERSERLAAGRAALLGELAGLAGGLVILALGLSLLEASFAPVHPLGLR